MGPSHTIQDLKTHVWGFFSPLNFCLLSLSCAVLISDFPSKRRSKRGHKGWSTCIVSPSVTSCISATKTSVNLWRGSGRVKRWNALNEMTAWVSLCHVKRPGIKASNITHPCGLTMVWAIRMGLWLYNLAVLVLCGPHWNDSHSVLNQSPHVASAVRAEPRNHHFLQDINIIKEPLRCNSMYFTFANLFICLSLTLRWKDAKCRVDAHPAKIFLVQKEKTWCNNAIKKKKKI